MLPQAPALDTPSLNNHEVVEPVNTHLEPSFNPPEWSILSETISYSTPPMEDLQVDTVHSHSTETQVKNDSPISSPPTLPTDSPIYQPYEGVQACLSVTANHDETTDVSTTFIGLVTEQSEHPTYTPEHSFPFDTRSCVKASLPNGEKFNILIDTGATRNYLSYGFYLECEYLKQLPKFKPLGPRVYMGNGEWVPTIHIIPVIFHVGNCAFEVFTLVCKMTSSDFIWGMKNVVETKGVICTRSMEYKFLNRSPKLISKNPIDFPADGSKHSIDLKLDFPKEVSGQAIVKLLIAPRRVLHTIKAPIVCNAIQLQISNLSKTPIIHLKGTVVGIVDIRSLGYFHIGMDQLKKTVLKEYQFKSLQNLMYQLNHMIDVANITNQCPHGAHPKDPYPWLEHNDPRRFLTDEQILDKTIDLSNSCLSLTEKRRLMTMLKRYKKAFSLCDEIGECPNVTLNIDVTDDSPFFVRPFPISEKDKPLMDKQMDCLVSLGILSENTSHTSPVMLITCKVTHDKRPVVDFCLLNTRIRCRNTASPLLRDIFNILGHSHCGVMSCVDIKDAFHSIRLNEHSKEFCGILPYFGSTHYRYEVLPMGLAINPAAWLMYVNMLLETFGESKKSFIAIMDDLLIHSTRAAHFKLVETLLKGLCMHGLKISPKKSQLFWTELTYMGNIFKIMGDRMTIHPLHTRLQAIQQYPRPHTVHDCKSFCGIVNYLSLFCKDLQKLLQPIYHLTRNGVPFRWTVVQEKNFNIIKRHLCESPVLTLPSSDGRFILYSDTSRTHTGSALWQIQDGFPCLIGYTSKTLPPTAVTYSVTELEMTGLLMNIHSWRGWTQGAEVDVAMDHKAMVQILKSKELLATG